MVTVEQRVLRGPNLWSRKRCLLTLAELGELAGRLTTDLPGFSDQLLALVPSMRPFAQPLLRGAFVSEVIGRLTLELQYLAGAPPDTGFVTAVHAEQTKVRIIVAYQLEDVAMQAFDVALDVVRHLCAGHTVDIAAHLLALQATAQRGAACTAGFDELIVSEADPRGRAVGETAAIILAGAVATGMDASRRHPSRQSPMPLTPPWSTAPQATCWCSRGARNTLPSCRPRVTSAPPCTKMGC